MFHPDEKRPKVGVAAVIIKEGKVLMGQRLNAHGADMWSFPSGHLEWNESWEECAIRETQEEAGVEIRNVRFLTATNDVMYADSTHYITIFMLADWADKEPQVTEPDKMVNWRWFDWDDLPEPLFYPVANLLDSGVSPLPDALVQQERQIVNATKEYVSARLTGESSGHDWWHSYRVWKITKQIIKHEECDQFVAELAALLHDISDYKLNGGDMDAGPDLAKEWLEHQKVESIRINQVAEIIRTMAFKGAAEVDEMKTIEGKIVQDADRLEAIGAVGIARCFAFGGAVNQTLYDPNINPAQQQDFIAYKNKGKTTSINHFYEKLLLVKDRMKTETGKRLAQDRHQFMEAFLEQFYMEVTDGMDKNTDSTDIGTDCIDKDRQFHERPNYEAKLVRDKIPEIIERNGERPMIRIADQEEYRDVLKEKLLEEAAEFKRDETPEEIADIFEVIDAICKEFGFAKPIVENLQREKKEKRGGFEEKIILEDVE
ncbi:MAG: NUDIX domain-containing protein [Patescibacteria group bacterium]